MDSKYQLFKVNAVNRYSITQWYTLGIDEIKINTWYLKSRVIERGWDVRRKKWITFGCCLIK